MSTKADFMINAVGPAVRFIGRLAQIVIALVGCSMLVAGHMTVGVFQAFFQFIYEASEPMTQLSFTFNSLQSALASAERVFDLLDEPEMEADPLPAAAAKLPGKVEGRIAFEHVRFWLCARQAAHARRVVYRRAGPKDRGGGNHGCG